MVHVFLWFVRTPWRIHLKFRQKIPIGWDMSSTWILIPERSVDSHGGMPFSGGGIFQTSNTSKPWISIQKASNFAGSHVWSLEGPALDQGCGGLPVEWQRRWFWIPLEGTTSRDLGKKCGRLPADRGVQCFVVVLVCFWYATCPEHVQLDKLCKYRLQFFRICTCAICRCPHI